MKKIIACIFVLVLFFSCYAQKVSTYSYINEKYHKYDAVCLLKKQNLNINVIDGKLDIRGMHEEEYFYLNAKAQYFAEASIYTSIFSEAENIKAYIYVPVKKDYKKIAVTNFIEKNEINGSIFYDDSKVTEITYPKIDTNYRTNYSFLRIIKNPRFLYDFYFANYIPNLKVEYSISFPDNVKISYKILNDDSNRITFLQKNEKGITTYTWSAINMPALKNEDNDAPIEYFMPTVVAYITEYTSGSDTIRILKDIGSLYKWDYDFIKNLNTNNDKLLKKLVDSITNGITEPIERMQKIYYWVQDNIRYVAFEHGLEGFIPREASDVYQQRYGDCKGMASLLTSLLKTAGLDAHYTWIGSRNIPYDIEELPIPGSFDHMISTVFIGDTNYFLDATVDNQTYKMPNYFIQGKKALIGFDENKFKIIKVPVEKSKLSYKSDSSFISINGNMVKGNAVSRYGGFSKKGIVDRINDKQQDQQSLKLKDILEKGNNKFKLIDYSVKNTNDREKDLMITYSFELNNYLISLNNDLYINMNLDKDFNNNVYELDKRQNPVMFTFTFTDKYYTELIIPEGYTVKALPEPSSYNSEIFGFEMKYRNEKNRIILEKTIYVNILMLNKQNFKQWNDMIKVLSKSYNQAIVLTKN
jgi:transglutaminase-like putative cysteine protease